MRRRLKTAAKVLSVTAIALITAYAVWGALVHRQLSAEIARLKAEGMPVALADLVPKKIPDSENAAVIYARVLKDSFGPSKIKCLNTLNWYLTPGAGPDEHPSNAAVEAILRRCNGSMAMLEQAAARPKCQYPVDWTAGAAASFEHLSYLRRLSTVLRARALFYARKGDVEEATRCIRLLFAQSESLKGRPTTVVCQYLRATLLSLATHSLQEVLQLSKISEIQAGRLHRALSRIDLLPETLLAFEEERAFGIHVFGEFRQRGRQVFVQEFGEGVDHGLMWEQPKWRDQVPLSRFAGTRLWGPMLDADELSYLKEMRKQIRLAGKSFRTLQGMGECYIDPGFPRYAYVARAAALNPGAVQMWRDSAITRLALAKAALALHVFHNRLGTYPRNLSELRTTLGWKLSDDPFSGRDLCYSRRDSGFLLYSVGPDLKDNGGARFKNDYPRVGHGDFVWGQVPHLR